MNARGLSRYIEDLLRGRRPHPFRPDDFEAAQIRTAIDLRSARTGGDAPRQEFLTDLHRRLAAQIDDTKPTNPQNAPANRFGASRRQVIVGTSAAAAAVAAGVTADHLLFRGGGGTPEVAAGSEMVPSDGKWQVVAASSEVADGEMRPFDLGTVVGFVRRVDGRAEAISGVCTHQGCRLWFDKPDDQLRCPCHTTSFSPTGEVLTHQLPIAPQPLPKLQARERNGAIEVFAPANPPGQAT